MSVNVTPEVMAKAKTAKTVEELMAMAEKANIKISEEQAKEFFDKLNGVSGEISDDELGNVSGGCCVHFY